MLAALMLALSFVQFWLQTVPVRLACADDAAFQEIVRHGSPDEYLLENARSQGRFFYAAPYYRHVMLSIYRIDSDVIFSLVRTSLLFAQAGLLGALAARLWRNPELGWTITLLLVSALHIPATFYPVLSFTGISVGFICFLSSLHFHLGAIRGGGAPRQLLATGLFLAACLCTEYFVVLAPAFVALSLHERGPRWSAIGRDLLGPGLAGLGYVATYLLFASSHPSSYSGTQLGINLPIAVKILARQLVSVIPGFELLVNRIPGQADTPHFRSLADIASGFASSVALLLGLFQGGVIIALLLAATRRSHRQAEGWPWLLGFAVLANVPVMVSAKYHVFLFHRTFPYVYAFFGYCFLIWAFADFVHSRCVGSAHSTRRRMFIAGAAILLATVSAKVANENTLGLLRQWYN